MTQRMAIDRSESKGRLSIIERFVKGFKVEKRRIGFLAEALGVTAREVISLVGAGGKTTLMFRLAGELQFAGRKVVTTTTTKIKEPAPGETAFLFVDPDEERLGQFVCQYLVKYKHITLASERLESEKLKGISTGLVKGLSDFDQMDYLIIEADGASGRPVKAPREGEPVIPSNTTLVIAILGVDGVGMKLNEENVFQAERVSKMTGISLGGKITEEAMALLMTHPKGIFKGTPSSSRVVAFLNKVDTPDGVTKGRGIAEKIFEKRHPQIERVVLGQLKKEPPVAEVIFP